MKKENLNSVVENVVKSPLVRHIIAETHPDMAALRKAVAATFKDSEIINDRDDRRAFWKDEIYTQPNPILQEPIRQFVVELLTKVQGEKKPDRRDFGLNFLEESIERDSFLWLQMLMFMAAGLGVKFPELETKKG
jgi:hypothetical protein